MKKAFKATLVRDGGMCHIPVTFDHEAVFGRARPPVRVTLNGYTFRSTVSVMGGEAFLPLRQSNREAAGLEGTETLNVTLELDEEPRVVEPPPELKKALKAAPPAWERWNELSFTHQKEYAEALTSAKQAETKARRLAAMVKQIAARPQKKKK